MGLAVMDIVGIVEVLIILGSLFAIFRYSQPQKETPENVQDFKQLMLRDIDQKLGPTETTEHGLLRKEYVLKLHKIIVYHNCRAS